MGKDRFIHEINGYVIEGVGGFCAVRYWYVEDSEGKGLGHYSTYREAKAACESKDFSGICTRREYI